MKKKITNFFWLLLWLCISKMICKTWKGARITITQNLPQQPELMTFMKKGRLPNISTNNCFWQKWAQVITLLGEKILRWPHLDVKITRVLTTKKKLEKKLFSCLAFSQIWFTNLINVVDGHKSTYLKIWKKKHWVFNIHCICFKFIQIFPQYYLKHCCEITFKKFNMNLGYNFFKWKIKQFLCIPWVLIACWSLLYF